MIFNANVYASSLLATYICDARTVRDDRTIGNDYDMAVEQYLRELHKFEHLLICLELWNVHGGSDIEGSSVKHDW